MEIPRTEQAAVYAALVPGYSPDKKRYPAKYRGGDSPYALAIDLERGWYDHVLGEGGDCIAFLQRVRQCDFAEALREIGAIIGRDLSSGEPMKPRPKHGEHTLCRAELLAVGLAWRIDRALELLKAELDGPLCTEAATAVRNLTRWQECIRSWRYLRLNGPEKDPRSYYEYGWTGRGQQEAVEVSRKLSPKIVRECIAEAEETYGWVAHVVRGLERVA
ncbi:MAG: hypothetical protein ACRD6B_03270 [Bryobacteraceae bacterium]